MPCSSEPTSASIFSILAPSRVASAIASDAVREPIPLTTRANRVAMRISSNPSSWLLQAAPSAPRPTVMRAARSFATWAIPAPSLRFDEGQCATDVFVFFRISSS